MNKLLVATDGSPAAEAAVLAGVQLAEEQGAAVVFLHVVEAIDVRVPSPPFGALEARPHVLAHPEQDDALAHAASVGDEHASIETAHLGSIGGDADPACGGLRMRPPAKLADPRCRRAPGGARR